MVNEMRRSWKLLGGGFAVAWVGCVELNTVPRIDGGGGGATDVQAVDTGVAAMTDQGMPPGDAGLTCVSGQTRCGGVCRVLASDGANCGACGNACPAGQTCMAGVCSNTPCALPRSMCGVSCSDLMSDVANCGACGRACAAGQICASGMCSAAAPITQRSCATPTSPGCGTVRLSGGTFAMGDRAGCEAAGSCGNNASPAQSNVTVGSFAIDAYEVTVARFRTWVTAGRPSPTGAITYRGGSIPFEGAVDTESEFSCAGLASNWTFSTSRPNRPMNCVNWATAQAFCWWDGNRAGRLPTEAEWEFAARGATGRVYPWGSDTPDDLLTCWSGSGMRRMDSCTVGSALPTTEGVFDLAGNVFEWSADWFSAFGGSAPACWSNTPVTDPVCSVRSGGNRVARGGSYSDTDAALLRSASRSSLSPTTHGGNLGFRCARDLP